MSVRVEHRSGRGNYLTPPKILERVRAIDAIGLDPASCEGNPTKAHVFVRPPANGLDFAWHNDHGLVFVNPPYGRKRGLRCREWVLKAIAEHLLGAEIVLLLPARTDTLWFQALLVRRYPICFVRGRLVFQGENSGAPFPSAVVYLGPRPKKFAAAFADLGVIASGGSAAAKRLAG